MAEPPAWVYDLVIELLEQQDAHPKLYFQSGAFNSPDGSAEGYAQYEWCPCAALKNIPEDVLVKAEAIRTYKQAKAG